MFHLSEALEALQGHDEFVVKKYDGLVSLDYILCFPGSFTFSEDEVVARSIHLWQKAGKPQDNLGIRMAEFKAQAYKDCQRFALIRRNCRGVTFDEVTGNLVSMPLHKFFNIGQVAETQFEVLSSCTAKVYEKCDGSMIHFFVHPVKNELVAATCRSAETPQAKEALALAKRTSLVFEKIQSIIDGGWTPIFEFVAPHNQIVVQYGRPQLIYLISRNRTTGEYRFDEGFPHYASSFDFPFSEINSHLDKQEFEGYVCHLDNGMMVKAKTPWYMERHRAVDALMRPAYKLYQVVYDGIMDDLLSTAPERFKEKLNAIYEEAQRDLLEEKKRLDLVFEECINKVDPTLMLRTAEGRKMDKVLRKEFVQLVQENHKSDFSLLMSLYVGNDPSEKIKERLMEGYKIKYPNKLFSDISDVEGEL